MQYRNIITGTIIDTHCKISSPDWVAVISGPSAANKKVETVPDKPKSERKKKK